MTFPNRPDESGSSLKRAPVIGPIIAGGSSDAQAAVGRGELVPPLFIRHEDAAPAHKVLEQSLTVDQPTPGGSVLSSSPQELNTDRAGSEIDRPSWLIDLDGALDDHTVRAESESSFDSSSPQPITEDSGAADSADVSDMWGWAGQSEGASLVEDQGSAADSKPETVSEGSSPMWSGGWDDGYAPETPPSELDVFASDSVNASLDTPDVSEAPADRHASTPSNGSDAFAWSAGEDAMSAQSDAGNAPDDVQRDTIDSDSPMSEAPGWEAFSSGPTESTSPPPTASVWQDDASGTGYGRFMDENVGSDWSTSEAASDAKDSNTYGFLDQPPPPPGAESSEGVANTPAEEFVAPDATQNSWESAADLSSVEPESFSEYIDEPEDESGDWYAAAVIVPEPFDAPAPPSSMELATTEDAAASAESTWVSPASASDPRAGALADRLERIAKALRSGGAGGALAEAGRDPLAALIAGYLIGASERTGNEASAELE